MTDQIFDATADPAPQASSTALQIAVLAALASIGTLATNILLPSLPQMAVSLKVTTPAVTASITIFLLVFALGQLLVGPISDRYGRRIPVLAGFAVFIFGSIWCGLANDLPTLLVGRAKAGPVNRSQAPAPRQSCPARSPATCSPARLWRAR